MFLKVLNIHGNDQPNKPVDAPGDDLGTVDNATKVRLIHPNHGGGPAPTERLPVNIYDNPVNTDDLNENLIGQVNLTLGESVVIIKKPSDHIFLPNDGDLDSTNNAERVFYTKIAN